MAHRASQEAKILNFFAEADLGKSEVVYNLVRDVMSKRLAPAKAAKAAKKKKKLEPNELNNKAAAS